jgi:hypothetical protein
MAIEGKRDDDKSSVKRRKLNDKTADICHPDPHDLRGLIKKHPLSGVLLWNRRDYSKHLRSIYYQVRLNRLHLFKSMCECAPQFECDSCYSPRLTIDFLFIPVCDMESAADTLGEAATVFDWMRMNFDMDICANAIFASNIQCLVPSQIARRQATLRQDQYCRDLEILKSEWQEGHYAACLSSLRRYLISINCNCIDILPRRYKKYTDRGYDVELGFVEVVSECVFDR